MQLQGYKDLIVWQKTMTLVKHVYELSDELPKSEEFRIIGQMIRSAISIPSNIAEGWSRNRKLELIRFFEIAYSSSCELETQVLIVKMQYLKTDGKTKIILDLVTEIQKMLSKLIKNNKTTEPDS